MVNLCGFPVPNCPVNESILFADLACAVEQDNKCTEYRKPIADIRWKRVQHIAGIRDAASLQEKLEKRERKELRLGHIVAHPKVSV